MTTEVVTPVCVSAAVMLIAALIIRSAVHKAIRHHPGRHQLPDDDGYMPVPERAGGPRRREDPAGYQDETAEPARPGHHARPRRRHKTAQGLIAVALTAITWAVIDVKTGNTVIGLIAAVGLVTMLWSLTRPRAYGRSRR